MLSKCITELKSDWNIDHVFNFREIIHRYTQTRSLSLFALQTCIIKEVWTVIKDHEHRLAQFQNNIENAYDSLGDTVDFWKTLDELMMVIVPIHKAITALCPASGFPSSFNDNITSYTVIQPSMTLCGMETWMEILGGMHSSRLKEYLTNEIVSPHSHRLTVLKLKCLNLHRHLKLFSELDHISNSEQLNDINLLVDKSDVILADPDVSFIQHNVLNEIQSALHQVKCTRAAKLATDAIQEYLKSPVLDIPLPKAYYDYLELNPDKDSYHFHTISKYEMEAARRKKIEQYTTTLFGEDGQLVLSQFFQFKKNVLSSHFYDKSVWDFLSWPIHSSSLELSRLFITRISKFGLGDLDAQSVYALQQLLDNISFQPSPSTLSSAMGLYESDLLPNRTLMSPECLAVMEKMESILNCTHQHTVRSFKT